MCTVISSLSFGHDGSCVEKVAGRRHRAPLSQTVHQLAGDPDADSSRRTTWRPESFQAESRRPHYRRLPFPPSFSPAARPAAGACTAETHFCRCLSLSRISAGGATGTVTSSRTEPLGLPECGGSDWIGWHAGTTLITLGRGEENKRHLSGAGGALWQHPLVEIPRKLPPRENPRR